MILSKMAAIHVGGAGRSCMCDAAAIHVGGVGGSCMCDVVVLQSGLLVAKSRLLVLEARG
jgi:hypothetical protein